MTADWPPGPSPLPGLGNLLAFRQDPLAFYTRLAAEYGDAAAYHIGPVRVILLSHPDLIEQVLVTDAASFIKGRVVRANRQLLGNGLLTSEGDFWRGQRRLIQPAFHRDQVAGYADLIIAHTRQLLATWRTGETRDLQPDLKRLTLGIIAQVLFGAEVAGEAEAVSGALNAAWETFTARLQSGLLIPEELPTPGNLRLRRAVRVLDQTIQGIVRRRRASAAAAHDCLALLLAAEDTDGRRLTETQLRDEVMTLFVAGHATTALVLIWGLYLLAQTPAAAARLRAEVEQVAGARPLQAGDIPRLPYTRMVIQEVLRLYPPVWAMPRQAARDCRVGGYTLPAGTSVTVSQWVMHRHPRYFDDPLAFRPERWDNHLEQRLPAFVYFPFGAGPRQCIGYTLAMTETTLILATIMQHWDFRLAPRPPVQPWPSITLYPRYGVTAQIECRSA